MTKLVQERRITWSKDNAHPLAGFRDDAQFDIGRMIRAIRRQTPLVATFAIAGIVISILLILGSVPRFTAVETVLLDEERAELLNEVSPLPNAVRSDTAIQSEMEIIRSRALALEVVDLLKLNEDPDFLSPELGIVEKMQRTVSMVMRPIAQLLSPAPPPRTGTEGGSGIAGSEGEDLAARFDLQVTDRDRAAQILRDRLSVSRSGRSLVIEIAFTGYDPTRTALIARGYGSAYENFQLERTNDVAATAEEWLRERLDVLEQKSVEAAVALQEFRAANDLVEVRGSLLTEQQQSELASELMTAAADAAEAEAQLDAMESLLARAKQGEQVIVVPIGQSQSSAGLEEMRRAYLDAQLGYDRLVSQFGAEHPQAEQLADRITALRNEIEAELEQVTEAARVAYNTSRSREQSLRRDLESATDASDGSVALRGRLQQLQAISETYAQVYRDYLARLEVTMQQQNFPIASVKIISPASVPKSASSPQKKSMLFAGMLLGGFVGMLIGAGRELVPKPIRTPSSLRQEVGVNCAGLIPADTDHGHEDEDGVYHRTIERLAQACEADFKRSNGVLVGISPLSPGLNDPDGLPAELALHLSRNGTRRVLLIHEQAAFAQAEQAGPTSVETVSLQAVMKSYSSTTHANSGETDLELLRSHLREKFSFVLLAMDSISRANRSDPHAWFYDTTILRIPWGQVLPSFVADALADHPKFRERLSTTVLEDAEVKTARRYMSPGSYEELEINA